GVLGEKAVARMDRIGTARARRGDDVADVEITVARRGRPDAYREVGELRVARARVRIGKHRDGADAQPPGGAQDAAGDLAAVRNQERADHLRSLTPPTSGRWRRASSRAAPGARRRVTARARDACPAGRSRRRPRAAPRNSTSGPGARTAREPGS